MLFNRLHPPRKPTHSTTSPLVSAAAISIGRFPFQELVNPTPGRPDSMMSCPLEDMLSEDDRSRRRADLHTARISLRARNAFHSSSANALHVKSPAGPRHAV